MRRSQTYVPWSVLLTSLIGVQAKLDLNSTSNIAIYWGQNSLQGKGGDLQKPLGEYCENNAIDVIPIAFNMMVNGPGGAPEIDFSVTSQDCDVFEGTQLKNCPKIGADIKKCQEKGTTILLSIGGATYSEGGFKSEDDAKAGAKLIWETFGPVQDGSKAKRPFGDAALDGFDFDFEANVMHMASFANELRSLMNKENDKQYFLTAAPQCPYPDQSDKDILNGPVDIDAVWVQFYNNYCGVNNFDKDSNKSKYNFEEWDNWAKTVSKNKEVKVLVGVPADTTAASTGYVPADKLADVIQYSKKFESFGGVMMWDMTQAYANKGFIDGVQKALGGGDSGSSSSSNSASTTASAPSSTNSPNTSQYSNVPDSSSSSSSSSASGHSSNDPAKPTTTAPKPTTEAPPAEPKPTTSAASTSTTSTTTAAPNTKPAPKPTTTSTTTTKPAPKPTSTSTATTKPTVAAEPEPEPTTTAAQSAPKPPVNDDDDDNNNDNSTDDTDIPPATNNSSDNDDTPAAEQSDDDGTKGLGGVLPSLLTSDLFGLLNGLRQANGPVKDVTNGLTKNLRFARRIQN
ncbi:Glycoside hydrolase superfamily [Penicillium argentinense]|uniref:chitinase n=1 Tax=Penicillium argentinense TaxID=1131581 RepID=A0A9W9FGC8_9EURO|nr:Glycoside hydrolase superfamily [Penicillium argentinense]KAJ5099619.1 Glycoside hydrolase superfamily [Penicillium argentinense]